MTSLVRCLVRPFDNFDYYGGGYRIWNEDRVEWISLKEK